MEDKIISRIQKLLALGEGQSCEAESSLAKAYKLMEEYNISQAQIEGASRDEVLGELGEESLRGNPVGNWQRGVLGLMTELFDCKLYSRKRRINYHQKQTTYNIVGREGNRRTAELMYRWLIDKIKKDSYYHGHTVAERNSYCLGVYCGLREKARSIKAAQTEKDAWGIVPINETEDYLRHNHPDLVKGRAARFSVQDEGAFDAGKQDGQNTSLNRQFSNLALPSAS